MEIPSNIRLRVLFQTGEKEYRKFYKFENKDLDLYWMPMEKGAHAEQRLHFDEKTTTITIPEDFEVLPKYNVHFSFHSKGLVHKKIENVKENRYKTIGNWGEKSLIKEPKRFFTILTKQLSYYGVYKKSLTEGKTSAIVLKSKLGKLDIRYYIEFYLSPEGTFPIPDTLWKISGDLGFVTQTLSPDLILVCRYGIIGGDINNFHPDKEIVIMPDDLK